MHHFAFGIAIPFVLTAVCFAGCGPDVDGGSGGSGASGTGTGGAAATGNAATGAGGSSDGGLTCVERVMSASQQVDAILQANLACATDADCTTVDVSTDCAGDCPHAVNLGGVAAVQAAVMEVNATVCKNYQEDGCPYATPGCAPPMVTCAGGACTLVF